MNNESRGKRTLVNLELFEVIFLFFHYYLEIYKTKRFSLGFHLIFKININPKISIYLIDSKFDFPKRFRKVLVTPYWRLDSIISLIKRYAPSFSVIETLKPLKIIINR